MVIGVVIGRAARAHDADLLIYSFTVSHFGRVIKIHRDMHVNIGGAPNLKRRTL